jgi:type II secretory ATPase GspE/PulE/Tfp pilus assembly ATPase PilB-like protein
LRFCAVGARGRKRYCAAWLAALLVALGAQVRAERIPLYNGGEAEFEVLGRSVKGLDVRMRDGSIRRLRWDQVDRSYPQHPLHGRRSRYEGRAPAPAPAPAAAGQPGLGAAESGGHFGAMLVAFFCGFWLWVYSVWRLGISGIYDSDRQRWVNLGAVLFGPLLAIPVVLRYRGLAGLGGYSRRKEPNFTEPGVPACRFFTWDNEPLVATSKRRFASGLALAELVMARAVKAGASDVHFDVSPKGVKMAMRVDGVLRTPEILDADYGRKAMTAIKMAAGMDLAKMQETQDGACHLESGSQAYDLRVARAWAVTGETLVVRLLRAGGVGENLTEMGMPAGMAAVAQDLTKETAGLIIMCGPTGSGKTSTIYGLLRRIQGTGRNILTIEDPVEYRLEQATQISLNAALGTTFASALKASMRHDPDVILVGEIRDRDAMNVAFQAALTGHLVFTTIHATSVLAAFGRLNELGLSAYMINTGLKVIVCQRLIRLLCPECREPYVPDAAELRFWGISPRATDATHAFYRPAGCKMCEQTGYRGRRGIYRMLVMNNAVRLVVRDDMATGDLQEAVEQAALGTVAEYAAALLWDGVTSPDEIVKTLDMFDFGKKLSHDHAL